MTTVLALLLTGATLGQTPDDQKAIQGVWKIMVLIENGKSLSENEILQEYTQDGLLEVEGNTVSLTPPQGGPRRKLIFLLNPNASPKKIDLAGGEKVSSKGIYTLSGDSLVLCLGTAKEPTRPESFAATSGSNQVMMVLQRTPKVPAPTSPAKVQATAPKAAPVSNDETLRRLLIGTWGHSTDDSKSFVTFNSDWTFSSTIEYTRGLRRVFDPTIRTSGTWRLNKGVVIVSVTGSTESSRRGQVYSFRISQLTEATLIAVDQEGRTRREWKVR